MGEGSLDAGAVSHCVSMDGGVTDPVETVVALLDSLDASVDRKLAFERRLSSLKLNNEGAITYVLRHLSGSHTTRSNKREDAADSWTEAPQGYRLREMLQVYAVDRVERTASNC